MRDNSGVSIPAALGVFLLPFGRPRRRVAVDGAFLLAAALALLAVFSPSRRTTCPTRIGNECRSGELTKDKVKKANPATALQ